MLNPKLKLNPCVFDTDVQQVPIRAGFGDGLIIAGDADPRVVALCADLTDSTKMNLFADKYPDRFIQVGIAEQNMASVASGLAAVEKIPFISSYAMFSPGRNWEQIRTTICYNDVPVKIAGSHAGISVGPDGGTHQALEDIALTRVIPNMVVLSPCDHLQARQLTVAMAQTKMPTYIRLGREKTPVITTDGTPTDIGTAQMFWQTEKPVVGIIATGSLVYYALCAALRLEEQGIQVNVLNIATIKPLDTDMVIQLAEQTGAIVTVEEHQIAGGLGSLVSETLAQRIPTPIEFIGVYDQFGQSGTPAELIKHYGMDTDSIIHAVQRVIERKK